MNLIGKALAELEMLIKSGVEYPEAHTQICVKYCVNGDELSNLYDEWCS